MKLILLLIDKLRLFTVVFTMPILFISETFVLFISESTNFIFVVMFKFTLFNVELTMPRVFVIFVFALFTTESRKLTLLARKRDLSAIN